MRIYSDAVRSCRVSSSILRVGLAARCPSTGSMVSPRGVTLLAMSFKCWWGTGIHCVPDIDAQCAARIRTSPEAPVRSAALAN